MKAQDIFKLGFVLFSFMLIGCQKESLRITDQQQEESFLADAQLVGLVRGVTAHDGSLDNIVDNSSCFSINFPYYCNVNGEVFYYEQASDLKVIYPTDEVEPVFPISMTYADYGEITVNSRAEFDDLIGRCASGLLYNDAIQCVDLIYPVSISMYNTETLDFQTVTFDHDRLTFTQISAMSSSDVASINFPIYLQIVGGEIIQIDSNQDLKAAIQSNLTFCF